MLRPRPVRSQIYLPVTVFGVVSSDWKFVLASGLVAYMIPYLLDLTLWKIPLELVTTVVAMMVTIAVLNVIRVGKKPHWLQHNVRALVQSADHRRRLPIDRIRGGRHWIRAG
ncbi:MAG: hypothetical protein DMF61_14860 [Blastocatellia bacterium AA13]|nr:MAG: hypothetical protein DMF61_14860 [Blastocatellia bacterium AA13]